MSDLFEKLQKEGKKQLQKELGITNIMAVPTLVKIVINIGLGEALENKKVIEMMSQQLAIICGQKPIVTIAKHDISSFKLRKGEPIGLKVTLRGRRMYDFFDKLVKVVFPRFRDFRGVRDQGFDGRGNFTLGISEQIVFPEIEYSKIDKIRGLEITFVTTGEDKKETRKLLEILGIPFRKGLVVRD
ncbi:MAG: hypothetical protein ACD_37C00018G0002 [uncultured bacterium]|nr:MAG: hypothetical protein ACD_37C00018G0002 [uncultured bacterium]